MEKAKFTDLINRLSLIAEKDKWVPKYDKNLDYFYWTKENISRSALLLQVSHEASLYVTPGGKVEGVLVEYMRDNFVAHNASYAGFVDQFTKKVDESTYTIKNKKAAEKYLFAFGESIRADIYQDAQEICKGDLDFDDLLKYATPSKG